MQDDALRAPLRAAAKRTGASFGAIAAELCFTLQKTEVAVHARKSPSSAAIGSFAPFRS
jgi:hypothetical protein